MPPCYATREDVTAATDLAETARAAAQIDRLLAAASRSVDDLCKRRFYPEKATRTVDVDPRGCPGRLWLDQATELLVLTSATSGGSSAGTVTLLPRSGPPYTRLDLDDAPAGCSVALTGTFGACADTAAAGALAASLDATSTTLAVTDSSLTGVGALLLLGTEYVAVTGKRLRATGQALTGVLTATKNGVLLAVDDPTAVQPGEVVTVDAERMLVTDTSPSGLIVERAWSGSVLAAHASGAVVYAPRTLLVDRAQLGTAAAAHTSGSAVRRHAPPPLVVDLTIAETLNSLAQEGSGYARTIGSGEGTRNASGQGIADLRAQVQQAHGRRARIRAV